MGLRVVRTIGAMATARFKDLCLDATNLEAMVTFWSATIGLDVVRTDSSDIVKLTGVKPSQTIWVNRVPEFKAAKNRVHVHAHVAEDELQGVSPVFAASAFGRCATTDPDGGEFCAFVRREVGPYRMHELVVDAVEPETLASWWAKILGGTTTVDEEGRHAIVGAAGVPFGSIVLARVPEAKTGKNRVHWDVEVDSVDVIAELESLGARVLRRPDSDIEWTVMGDPEGNEFCVFIAT